MSRPPTPTPVYFDPEPPHLKDSIEGPYLERSVDTRVARTLYHAVGDFIRRHPDHGITIVTAPESDEQGGERRTSLVVAYRSADAAKVVLQALFDAVPDLRDAGSWAIYGLSDHASRGPDYQQFATWWRSRTQSTQAPSRLGGTPSADQPHQPAAGGEDPRGRVWTLDGSASGRKTGGTRACGLGSCVGHRIGVRWSDGTMGWPCTKGMMGRPDGSSQLA